MLEFVIAFLVGIPVTYFIWTAVHEMSHYIAMRCIRTLDNVSFKLYPHFDEKHNFLWASVSFEPRGEPLSAMEEILVNLAPRIPDMLAVILLVFTGLIPIPWFAGVWMAMWAGGLIDLAVGSIGTSEVSDLQKASVALGWNPWVLRIIGWSTVIISVVVLILVFVF